MSWLPDTDFTPKTVEASRADASEGVEDPAQKEKRESSKIFLRELFLLVKEIQSKSASPLEMVKLARDPKFFPHESRFPFLAAYRSLVLHAALVGKNDELILEILSAGLSERTVVQPLQFARRLGEKTGIVAESALEMIKNFWTKEVGRAELVVDENGKESLSQPEIVNPGLNSEYSCFYEAFKTPPIDYQRAVFLKFRAMIHDRREEVISRRKDCVPYPKKDKYMVIYSFGKYRKKISISGKSLENFESFQKDFLSQIEHPPLHDSSHIIERISNLKALREEYKDKKLPHFENPWKKQLQTLLSDLENESEKFDHAMKQSGYVIFRPSSEDINRAFSGQERFQDEAVQNAILDETDHTACDMAIELIAAAEVDKIDNLINDMQFLSGIRIPTRMIFAVDNQGLIKRVIEKTAHPMADGAAIVRENIKVLEQCLADQVDPISLQTVPIPRGSEVKRHDELVCQSATLMVGAGLGERGMKVSAETQLKSEVSSKSGLSISQRIGTKQNPGIYEFYADKKNLGEYAVKISLPLVLHYTAQLLMNQDVAHFLDGKEGRLGTIPTVLSPDLRDYLENYDQGKFDKSKFEELLASFNLLTDGRQRFRDGKGDIPTVALLGGKAQFARKAIEWLGSKVSQRVTEISTKSVLTSVLVGHAEDSSQVSLREFSTAISSAHPKGGVGFCEADDGRINVVINMPKEAHKDFRHRSKNRDQLATEVYKIINNLLQFLEDAQTEYFMNNKVA